MDTSTHTYVEIEVLRAYCTIILWERDRGNLFALPADRNAEYERACGTVRGAPAYAHGLASTALGGITEVIRIRIG